MKKRQKHIWLVEFRYTDPGIYIPWLEDFAMTLKGKWQCVNHNAYPAYVKFEKKWHLDDVSKALVKCIKSYPNAICAFDLSDEECKNIKAVLKMQEAILGISFGDVYIQRNENLKTYSSFTKDELEHDFLKIL